MYSTNCFELSDFTRSGWRVPRMHQVLKNLGPKSSTSQVGGVLETSEPPLDDGHRDFEDAS